MKASRPVLGAPRQTMDVLLMTSGWPSASAVMPDVAERLDGTSMLTIGTEVAGLDLAVTLLALRFAHLIMPKTVT